MIEYTYPECTSSVVLSLRKFTERYPDYRGDEIERCIQKAIQYIFAAQRTDGSWFGSWGICFTYASMFSLKALASEGFYYSNSPRVRQACEFLLDKQKNDGGWGETFQSCETGEYVQHERSQVVQTAWALLSLLVAKYPYREPLDDAAKLIMSRQQPNGEWLQESLEGVFNKNCTIAYPNFKHIFTVWALGLYAKTYGNTLLE
ncbi:hypothetical protein IWQ62_006614 [Dispira parvispora]|uniref:lanosterol synthase n=1 Tax=Dispira parvispora TaxID=1520584 RepID=A0A9W8ANP9_9FUNG|nr:hypothetical protein IWQ62_006614 [Dispira parvispora]